MPMEITVFTKIQHAGAEMVINNNENTGVSVTVSLLERVTF